MMLLSLCIPCHNRTHDLKVTMPYLIEAANASPPVEIVIVDYNSQDDLRDYFFSVYDTAELAEGNYLTYKRYAARDHYHMAHARNISALAASGEYIFGMGADIYFTDEFIPVVRDLIANGFVFMKGHLKSGMIVCRKDEFVKAGGFDEQFEFYGPEDKDFAERMKRRGYLPGLLPEDMIEVIPTNNKDKARHYRLNISKWDMKDLMRPIYEDNIRKGIRVANRGGWGSWT